MATLRQCLHLLISAGRRCCHSLNVLLYIYPRKAGFCFFYYFAIILCVQIIEYIMARWSYLFVCTLYYLIIIIINYLTVLNLYNACLVQSIECVSMIKSVLSIIFHVLYGVVCIQLGHEMLVCTLCLSISLCSCNIIIMKNIFTQGEHT